MRNSAYWIFFPAGQVKGASLGNAVTWICTLSMSGKSRSEALFSYYCITRAGEREWWPETASIHPYGGYPNPKKLPLHNRDPLAPVVAGTRWAGPRTRLQSIRSRFRYCGWSSGTQSLSNYRIVKRIEVLQGAGKNRGKESGKDDLTRRRIVYTHEDVARSHRYGSLQLNNWTAWKNIF